MGLDCLTVDLRATGDWIEPDLAIVVAQESMLEEWLYRPDQVILLAEVVSRRAIAMTGS